MPNPSHRSTKHEAWTVYTQCKIFCISTSSIKIYCILSQVFLHSTFQMQNLLDSIGPCRPRSSTTPAVMPHLAVHFPRTQHRIKVRRKEGRAKRIQGILDVWQWRMQKVDGQLNANILGQGSGECSLLGVDRRPWCGVIFEAD